MMEEQDDGLVGLAEIAEYFGVARTTAHHWTQRPDFPKPRWQLRMGPVWMEREVRYWVPPKGRKS